MALVVLEDTETENRAVRLDVPLRFPTGGQRSSRIRHGLIAGFDVEGAKGRSSQMDRSDAGSQKRSEKKGGQGEGCGTWGVGW